MINDVGGRWPTTHIISGEAGVENAVALGIVIPSSQLQDVGLNKEIVTLANKIWEIAKNQLPIGTPGREELKYIASTLLALKPVAFNLETERKFDGQPSLF